MKLEHLIQGYNFNRIPAKINKEISEEAGVINFYDGITASYLLDDEEIVICLNVFINCLAKEMMLDKQIQHTTKVINVLQQSIMLLTNITQEEANIILQKLGLFDGSFSEGKQIKLFDYAYKVKVVDGLLCFTINEMESDTPGKISSKKFA